MLGCAELHVSWGMTHVFDNIRHVNYFLFLNVKRGEVQNSSSKIRSKTLCQSNETHGTNILQLKVLLIPSHYLDCLHTPPL